jgi:site-specific recombinase XerD
LYHDLLRLIDAIQLEANPAKVLRDKALVLVWWTGLFRRSEIVSLRVEHVEISDEGAAVLLPRSKTDQEGQGRRIGIPRSYAPEACPVMALQALIEHLSDKSGAIFRNLDRAGKRAGTLTDVSANRLLKHYAKQAGLDFKRISGHSMRSGGATEAARRGVDLWKLQQHGGWKDARMLTERYIRGGRLFADNPMSFI